MDNINLLRNVFRKVKTNHQFKIDAMVILSEHMHRIWTLPPGEADYKTRWALIKAEFSRGVPASERRSESRMKRGERGIWRGRYWEHLVRDEEDFQRHVDYIHWPLMRILRLRHLCIPAHRNPAKHGWVEHVTDWLHSSFHAYVRRCIYLENWGFEPDKVFNAGE